MKTKINEIHSKKMFPDLIAGTPREGMYQKSLNEMIELLEDDIPINNISEPKWVNIKKSTDNTFGYGSYGHITGVKLQISEGYDNYDFSLIFNFYPELENLKDVVNKSVKSIDWKNNSLKWDAGDL